MPMISDRSERKRLAKLDQRVREFDIGVLAAEADREDLAKRKALLEERLTAEEATRPIESKEAEDAAADVLLRDPNASTTTLMERILPARRKREQARSEWRAGLKPIVAAIDKAELEIKRRNSEIEDLKVEREKAYQAFIHAAQPALMAEMERRLTLLHDEVYAPMRALEADAKSTVLLTMIPGNPIVEAVSYEDGLSLKRRDKTLFPRTEVNSYRWGSTTGDRREPVPHAPYLEKLRAELRTERG